MAVYQIDSLQKTFDIDAFQKDLIEWFKAEQRSLPWRADRDPYKVWVSEIMLQQTRVETVIPFFNRFMEWFPTLESFADADEERILKAWEGLGYYSRVRNLQSAVREVKENYGGVVPEDPKEIIALKGVGPYTAGAILSIAYGIPEPAVDGNVMRVLSRILYIKEDIAKPKTRKIFEDAVRVLISHDDPSAFNQGLMELGAMICVPGKPACLLCPVREHCAAFAKGVQKELPVKNKVKKTKNKYLWSCIIRNADGRVLVQKRPEKGLLANLWEFPSLSADKEKELSVEAYKEWFRNEFGGSVDIQTEAFTNITHVFSHLKWQIAGHVAQLTGELSKQANDDPRLMWVSEDDMKQIAFPVPYQKMFQAYRDMP
ncbi:MAG: A/G-specific adenine glycosylase [Bacillus sp. (in: firmicutes)]